jgi:hypothetical protein
MSIFDQAYDEMTLVEVCVRLPGDLAIRALKRRINDLVSLKEFVETVASQPADIKEVRSHINSVLNKYAATDILDTFPQEYHPSLFKWLSEDNAKRLKEDGKDKLTRKFKFNLSKGDELDTLDEVLKDVLAEEFVQHSQVISVLNKADATVFNQLLDRVVKDKRPEVRQCILSVVSNRDLLSEHQLTMGLKAFAQSGSQLNGLGGLLSFKSFSSLKPAERLPALQKYFNYFPKYRQLQIFSPEPSKEEFDLILFAGCIEQNDLVTSLSSQYQQITEELPPKDTEDDSQP